MWLIGAVVCLLAANRGSNCSLTRAMDGRVVRCGIVSSCQSAATSEIVKRFYSCKMRYNKYRVFTFMNTFIRPSMDNQQTDRQRQIYTDRNSTNLQVKMSITHIKP